MSMLYPNIGELWYLRLLLLNIPIRSFEEAKIVDGTVYETFQKAAIARGLCRDQVEATRCFKDAMIFSSPPELRELFPMRSDFPQITQH